MERQSYRRVYNEVEETKGKKCRMMIRETEKKKTRIGRMSVLPGRLEGQTE